MEKHGGLLYVLYVWPGYAHKIRDEIAKNPLYRITQLSWYPGDCYEDPPSKLIPHDNQTVFLVTAPGDGLADKDNFEELIRAAQRLRLMTFAQRWGISESTTL